MRTVVLASGNAGKLREFQQLLAQCGFEVRPQSDFGLESPEETGLTFVENALIKARYASAQTGLPAIADDSGLAVEALQGAPGIYSARYAGPDATDEENNQHLLNAMADFQEPERGARYHCVLAFLRHAEDPTPLLCHGQWDGTILTAPQGNGGFGYDPLFYIPSHNCSVAELDPTEKSRISHRAVATRELLAALSR